MKSRLKRSKLNFITPSCQHKTGIAVESVVFWTHSYCHVCPLLSHKGLRTCASHRTYMIFIFTSLLAHEFIECIFLPALHHTSQPLSSLIFFVILPFSTSVCRLIISLLLLPSSLLSPSVYLSMAEWSLL